MKKSLLILVLLLLTPVFSGFCTEIVIDFTVGGCFVDLHGKKEWTEACTGMKLNESSVIQTKADGEMELRVDDGEKIAIGNNTTIEVHDIVINIQERSKITWFRGLTKLFNVVTGLGSEESELSILGIRGEMEEEEGLDWMTDIEEEDFQSQFDSGKKMYEDGVYSEAINIFKEIIDCEEAGPFRGEIAYYLGSSLFNNVQYEQALPYLEQSIKERDVYYRESALMHFAFAHFFSGNYHEAIEGSQTYIAEYETGKLKPYALLMMGKSYKVLGRREEASRYFKVIVRDYRNTDVYNDALSEMEGL